MINLEVRDSLLGQYSSKESTLEALWHIFKQRKFLFSQRGNVLHICMLVDFFLGSDWRRSALQEQPVLWQRSERPERGYREAGKLQQPVSPPIARQQDGGILWTRRSPDTLEKGAAPVLRERRLPSNPPVMGKPTGDSAVISTWTIMTTKHASKLVGEK